MSAFFNWRFYVDTSHENYSSISFHPVEISWIRHNNANFVPKVSYASSVYILALHILFTFLWRSAIKSFKRVFNRSTPSAPLVLFFLRWPILCHFPRRVCNALLTINNILQRLSQWSQITMWTIFTDFIMTEFIAILHIYYILVVIGKNSALLLRIDEEHCYFYIL